MGKLAGGHAVVLGGSIAGLLAARVLADHFEQVTVVERDVLPHGPEPRRGVPQGRHLHGLQPGGCQVLDELFEGFTAEMVADGASTGDVLGNIRWILSGHRFKQAQTGLDAMFSSRPFLEAHIRGRVLALPNVRVRMGTDVLGLSVEANRVTGVRVLPHEAEITTATDSEALDAASEKIAADLVVDATGRGSRTPAWLERLGFERPEAERVEIDVWYATRRYRLREGALGTDRLIATAPTLSCRRSAVLTLQENGECLVTLVGRHEQPAIDAPGFEDYAASLPFPDITDALRDAEPLSDAVRFRFPASVRHRYERLTRLPERLLVIGDAVCSFNPVYGQGMSVAANEAKALGTMLATGIPTPRAWFRAAAKVVDTPWQTAVSADLADPSVPGKRTRMTKLAGAYIPKAHAAASIDPVVGEALTRVMGMVDPPTTLFAPRVLLRVLRTHKKAPGLSPAAPAETGPAALAEGAPGPVAGGPERRPPFCALGAARRPPDPSRTLLAPGRAPSSVTRRTGRWRR